MIKDCPKKCSDQLKTQSSFQSQDEDLKCQKKVESSVFCSVGNPDKYFPPASEIKDAGFADIFGVAEKGGHVEECLI